MLCANRPCYLTLYFPRSSCDSVRRGGLVDPCIDRLASRDNIELRLVTTWSPDRVSPSESTCPSFCQRGVSVHLRVRAMLNSSIGTTTGERRLRPRTPPLPLSPGARQSARDQQPPDPLARDHRSCSPCHRCCCYCGCF